MVIMLVTIVTVYLVHSFSVGNNGFEISLLLVTIFLMALLEIVAMVLFPMTLLRT